MREVLKRRLFRKCDSDEDGFLDKADMRILASLVGFEGTDAEWDEEFEKLCTEHSLEPGKGIPEKVVLDLLEDQSDSGCYCTNKELRHLLGYRKPPSGSNPQGDDETISDGTEGRPGYRGGTGVFFTGADFNTPEAVLRSAFEAEGNVREFHLFRQHGLSRGMGRVQYQTVAEAHNAIKSLNMREIDGRTVIVKGDKYGKGGEAMGGFCGGFGGKGGSRYKGMGGENASSVYFTGASPNTPQRTLKAHFQQTGNVTQFWLFQLPTGRSRGMGIVEYSTPAEASQAIKELHGSVLDGHQVFVKEDESSAKGGCKGDMQPRIWAPTDGYGSYGKGRWGRGWDLEVYGWDKGKGYGKGKVEGKGVPPGFCGKGALKGKGLVGEYEPGSRVYFAGARFTAVEAELEELFTEFGDVRSLNLKRLMDGRSRGMGVVTFGSAASAAHAIRTGVVCDGHPLFLKLDEAEHMGKGGYAIAPFGGKGAWSKDGHFGGYDGYQEPYPDYDYGDYGGDWMGGGKGAMRQRVSVQQPSKAVFFKNVPFGTTESHIRTHFEAVGQVARLTVFTTPDGKSRGMGIVEYATEACAERAYYELHESMISGRCMVVDQFRGALR